MLVLSRKVGESLVINGELELRIIEISGDKVRVGIEAPKNYRVLRKELCMTVESNKDAAGVVRSDELIAFMGRLGRDAQQREDEKEKAVEKPSDGSL